MTIWLPELYFISASSGGISLTSNPTISDSFVAKRRLPSTAPVFSVTLIVPTGAVRDEGTSYHYLAPSEEITPDQEITKHLIECLKRCGCPYTTGKIWTTDGIYRETLNAITERKEAGCIAVDMEYSALLAAAKYRHIPFVQFFYSADSLDHGEWEQRDLTDYGVDSAEKYFMLALECGLALYRDSDMVK